MSQIWNLIADTAEGAPAGTGMEWVTYVILGVLLVGMVLLMVIPQKRQKKRVEQMMATLAIGSIVTTIGGIVGEVVEMDDKHIWLLTGMGDNKTTMQFVRQAIHSIAPAGGDTEFSEQKAAKEKEDEVDEIK